MMTISELNPHGLLSRCVRFDTRRSPDGMATLATGLPATALTGPDFHRLGLNREFH